MRAGLLDRRVTLQKALIAQNDTGEEIKTWVDVATVWAEEKPTRGGERFTNPQLIGKAPTTFRIRWSSTVRVLTDLHRAKFDGRYWDIVDVREINRREGIEFDAFARGEIPVARLPVTFDSTITTFDLDSLTWDAV